MLDADSSQQVVIEAAKSGSSFVVQGPPGTGKSQTIVNMIAELIGDGKSVLLVAEKETALIPI
ncbi:AAA domain-containing protein [Tolypothrix sp. NIES-4075]|uniref:AAA domain-containing protein n=1 Tax=Tolypothrix sp. NIES-4075 TaxID=2005459 RepID=UPI00352F0B61